MTDRACQCIQPTRPVPHEGHCCLRDLPADFDRHTMRLLCHDGEWRDAYPLPDDRAPLPGQETLL